MAYQTQNKNSCVILDTANPNLDGTGSIVTLYSSPGSPAYGSVVETVRIQSLNAVQMGMVRFFIKSSEEGAQWKLLKELPIPEMPDSQVPYPLYNGSLDLNLTLQNGWMLGVSSENNTYFNVFAFGLDIIGFI